MLICPRAPPPCACLSLTTDAMAPTAAWPELRCAALRCGRYLVRGFLASGGMGCVLDAEDIVARRRVALKARSSGSAANIWSSGVVTCAFGLRCNNLRFVVLPAAPVHHHSAAVPQRGTVMVIAAATAAASDPI